MILLLAGTVQAQQLPQAAGEASGRAPAEPAPTPVDGPVTTLDEVRALKPEDDQPLNLYRFKNPVQPAPNRFSKNWSEPPSPEQVGMSGGYVMMGIAYGLLKAGQGLNKLTGGPDQIQSAIARPPPELSAEQQARAAAFCAQQDCTQAGDGR